MKRYKTGAVTICVDYGYDIHEIIFSGRTYSSIKSGSEISIKGQGFGWDGEPDQDIWLFNSGASGAVHVYTEGGGDIFTGNLEDEEVMVSYEPPEQATS